MNEMVVPDGRTAIIVAHGDDETLWCGGLLARYKGFDVICCSIPKHGPERILDFCKAVKLLGHHPFVLPFPEESYDAPLTRLDLIELDTYDTIITHNAMGEYGHLHHKQVHAYISMRFGGLLFHFGYGFEGGDYVLTLSDQEQRQKLEALRCYDREAETEKRGGIPKSQALLNLYSDLDLQREIYLKGGFKSG